MTLLNIPSFPELHNQATMPPLTASCPNLPLMLSRDFPLNLPQQMENKMDHPEKEKCDINLSFYKVILQIYFC